MVLSWIWVAMILIATVLGIFSGNAQSLGPAVLEGAQKGLALSISIGGAICLWSGIGTAMEHSGFSSMLAKLFRPFIQWLFPAVKTDPEAARYVTANFCANLLGLGNAATPMGIAASKRLALQAPPGQASADLCRLIVMNTASIQLIPANVAAVRASLGATRPFDILPAVWLTSLCSVSVGLLAAWLMERCWKR